MKISLKNFTIPFNYVLIKPDAAFETYQFGGKETGIIAPTFKYDKGKSFSDMDKHVSVCGDVYAVPERLIYNGRRIREIQADKGWAMDRSVRKEVDHLRETTLQYDVSMDVQKGDKVYFDYLAYKNCLGTGRMLDTEEGTMMLIKYDLLIMSIRKDAVIMLNGYVLIENEQIEFEKEDGVEGITTAGGLFIPNLRKKEIKARKTAQATIIYSGSKCHDYLDNAIAVDGSGSNGDKILYDPRFSKELEFGLHQAFSEKKLRRIQRKDIHLIL